MINNFPADDVLLARGKYSTLAGQRREHVKALREHMEAIADYARRVVRAMPDDLAFAQEQLIGATDRLEKAKLCATNLYELEPQLTELKPLAWAKETPE